MVYLAPRGLGRTGARTPPGSDPHTAEPAHVDLGRHWPKVADSSGVDTTAWLGQPDGRLADKENRAKLGLDLAKLGAMPADVGRSPGLRSWDVGPMLSAFA